MLKIKEVTPLEGYILKVLFENDEAVLYDVLEDIESIETFQPLKDECSLFAQVRLDESRTCIYWNEQIDLAADSVYRYGEKIKK